MTVDLCVQTLTHAGWKQLWPNDTWHKQIRHMLGNLTLMTAEVNGALGNKALMREALAAYKEGPVHWISTSDLSEDDWVILSCIDRHRKIVTALAMRLGLPIERFINKLPKIGTTPATNEDRLENTAKLK